MRDVLSELAADLLRSGTLPLIGILALVGLVVLGICYWTRWGNDHLPTKCASLALLVHGMIGLAMTQWPTPQTTIPEALDEIVSIEIQTGSSPPPPTEALLPETKPTALPAEPLAEPELAEEAIERSPPPAPTDLEPPPHPDVTPEDPLPIVEANESQRPEENQAPLPEAPKLSPQARTEIALKQRRDETLDLPLARDLNLAPEAPTVPAPSADVNEAPTEITGPRVALSEPPPPSPEANKPLLRKNVDTDIPPLARNREEDLPVMRDLPSDRPKLTPSPPAAPRTLPDIEPALEEPAVAMARPDLEASVAEPPRSSSSMPEGRFDLETTLPRRALDSDPVPARSFEPSREVASLDLEKLLTKRQATTDAPMNEFWENRLAPNRLDIVFRHGGSERTERAVASALEWLAAHQSEDGRWDSDGFSDYCPDGDLCEGDAIERQSDTGLTGLALLAFLGAGHTHLESKVYKEPVRRGLSWLMRTQRPDGDLQYGGRIYCHAMATLALTEAYAMSKDPRLQAAAQRAITWLAAAQHAESGGWRYGPNQFGDTSVYGWAVLALRSAEKAGLVVPANTWIAARRWLPLVTSGPNGGLAAYRPGYPPSHAMTAEALFCRQVLGDKVSPALVEEAASYVLSRTPDERDYHLYYWYYGTLALFQVGGPSWQRWNDRLTATLLDSQKTTGHAKGSWDPGTPFGIDGGRIFSTATSALCLEVYYRYLPIYAAARGR